MGGSTVESTCVWVLPGGGGGAEATVVATVVAAGFAAEIVVAVVVVVVAAVFFDGWSAFFVFDGLRAAGAGFNGVRVVWIGGAGTLARWCTCRGAGTSAWKEAEWCVA